MDPAEAGPSSTPSTSAIVDEHGTPVVGWLSSLSRWLGMGLYGDLSDAEKAEFVVARDRAAKAQASPALIVLAVMVIVLSTANVLVAPEYYPFFHVLDFAAAIALLGTGLWLRRPSTPPRVEPWTLAICIMLLALVILSQAWVAREVQPAYLLIVITMTGPLTLAWRPFSVAAVAMVSGTAMATVNYVDVAVVDWTLMAAAAAIASAVLLQLRLRSIQEEVHVAHVLVAQTQRLELVLSASRLGLWDWNLQTGELILDERWAEIVGYRLTELEPTNDEMWRRLSHPDDLLASDAAFAAHFRGETPFYDYEGRLRHRDGHWVWIRDRGKVVAWTPDGEPLRITGTLEDITACRVRRSAG